MALEDKLLALLRCPESGGELLYIRPDDGEPAFLFCPQSRLKFRIDPNDIPVLLLDEAERLDEAQSDALAELAAQHGAGGD